MTAPDVLPTREEIAEILHDGFEHCHDAFMQKHYGETAFQPFHQEVQEEIDCWLAAADVLLACLRPAWQDWQLKEKELNDPLATLRAENDRLKYETNKLADMREGWLQLKRVKADLRACAEALAFADQCCRQPNDCKWGGTGGCGYECGGRLTRAALARPGVQETWTRP